MSDISVTGSAFAGLKALRERPATLLVWWLLTVLMAIGAMAAFAAVAGSAMADLQAIRDAGPNVDPTAALGATGKMMGGVLMMIPVYLILGSVSIAAANRAILRPEASGLGYLRLGGDEWRTLIVLLVLGLIFFFIYFVGAFVAGIAGVLTSGIKPGEVPDQARILPAFLLAFAPFAIVMVLLAMKFSVATAQTLDTKAIAIFGSWGLTKGHFGKIFLTYLLAGVIYLAVYCLAMAIVFGAWSAMGVENPLGKLQRPDMTSVAAVLAPPMLVYFVVVGLAGALGMALTVCPGAALYRQIAGRQEDAFE
jgi:hypothetical protein